MNEAAEKYLKDNLSEYDNDTLLKYTNLDKDIAKIMTDFAESQLKAKDKMKFREIKLDTKEFSFNDVKEIIKAKDKEIRELKTRCRSVIRASKKDPWVLQSAIDKLSNHLNK